MICKLNKFNTLTTLDIIRYTLIKEFNKKNHATGGSGVYHGEHDFEIADRLGIYTILRRCFILII